MLETAKDIIERVEQMKNERSWFESEWQECADNLFGRREFTTKPISPRSRTREILDTTAKQSLVQLAGGLQGLLADPSTPWFSVLPTDDELRDERESIEWFEEVTKRMRRGFALPKASFSVNMAEIFYDIGGFGTSAMMTVDMGDYTHYSARPLGEVYIEENHLGVIDIVAREFEFTARQAALAWGEGKTQQTNSKKLNEALKRNPMEKFTFYHLVHRVDDPSAQPGKLREARKPWRSVYVMHDDTEILTEGGYFELPIHVARWSREAGETYGRGPGMTAKSDGKMLNEMMRTLLSMGQKVADPPLTAPDDGILTQIITSPGSINIVKEDLMLRTKGNPIGVLPTGTIFPITQEIINDVRQSVRETFFATLMQLFRDPRMTATQVLELSAEAQRMMAPMLSRLKTELLDPMVQRTFFQMLRRGQLPPVPQILRGRDFEVQYNSPVLRSQRLPEARATMEVWQSAAAIAEMGAPQIMDGLNPDETLKIIHEARGAPIGILRSDQDRDAVREARAAQQAAAAELEQMQGMAKAAGDVGMNVAELTREAA